jgi:hypothetical protein
MPRKNRTQLRLPAPLMDACGALADATETELVLTDFIHHAVITATKAAERGDHHLLPRRQPRNQPAPEGGKRISQFVASKREAARCAAALEAAGSSVHVCVIRALEALRDAKGVWLDTVVPGEAGWSEPAGLSV